MYKIAVIGGEDTVTGFKALGLDTYPSASAEEAARALRELAAGGEHAIIYIEEDFAAELSAEIAKYDDTVTPAIILIPGRSGPLGIAQSALQNSVIRAIGTDI